MKKPGLLVAAAALIALLGGAAAMQWFGTNERAAAQAPKTPQPRLVSVEMGTAVKKRVPVVVEALGTVTPLASVAVRTRIDSEIVNIHFSDGSLVKAGDLLVSLDTRALEAQIRQAEAQLARDQAQLEGAERDLRRYTELVARQATPQMNLDNARTQADVYRAAIRASQALIDNLKVQLSYCSIHAAINGRISQANVKIGNFVRVADGQPIATINQVAPVYVSFTIPQRVLPEVRRALATGDASIEAIVPGEERRAQGAVTMIENAVDSATGMATIRATMPNADELLWPGTLVTARLTLRTEESIAVPAAAVQVSQQGTFVYVVADGTARVRPVKVSRTQGGDAILESGLLGGEAVVTDGHLQLGDGARVAPRAPQETAERKAGT
ncbi:MAG TPA: efflux RND transporter periplasmic adaptor subunit [Rhodoplanes sp.]|nr:efflux RND transporter periplasmic adaptor subunit [Rhodoplanes sp.]